jgi:hypothetical protein
MAAEGGWRAILLVSQSEPHGGAWCVLTLTSTVPIR